MTTSPSDMATLFQAKKDWSPYNSESGIFTKWGAFDPLHPDPDLIDIRDIAQGLGHTCRFNGQVVNFYSVAQHSIMVSKIVPDEYRLHALLHDAAEAYLGDVVRPLKQFTRFEIDGEIRTFAGVEKHLLDIIFQVVGLTPGVPKIVARADDLILPYEIKTFMRRNKRGLSPEQSSAAWLRYFWEYI